MPLAADRALRRSDRLAVRLRLGVGGASRPSTTHSCERRRASLFEGLVRLLYIERQIDKNRRSGVTT
ncbi:hypothetical protein SAMN02799616_03344 [Paenibacillus sp. UNC499MF]|nr:hypothetical protein SAMN02799616_03344 [Paenibacillus sp. UNC499MF]